MGSEQENNKIIVPLDGTMRKAIVRTVVQPFVP